jgi:NADPH-dependent 2,4-dienoyl-CoA reductase/sulfur reductase-like enzyme
MGGDINSKSDDPIIAVPQTSGGNPAAIYQKAVNLKGFWPEMTNRSAIVVGGGLAGMVVAENWHFAAGE